MFAPRSGQPLSTHARNAAKYTLYLLFIHRERFLRVYSLKWMCALLGGFPLRYERPPFCPIRYFDAIRYKNVVTCYHECVFHSSRELIGGLICYFLMFVL